MAHLPGRTGQSLPVSETDGRSPSTAQNPSLQHLPNAAGGRSPTLEKITPSAGQTARFFYDAAGNQTVQSGDTEKLRSTYDSESRLAQVRKDSAETISALSSFTYDGRGFLDQATFSALHGSQPQVQTAVTYSSEGLLLHRSTTDRPGPTTARGEPLRESDAHVIYFAGRPLAIFETVRETAIDGTRATIWPRRCSG